MPVAAPHDAPHWGIRNARIPMALTPRAALAADSEGLARVDMVIDGDRIASLLPAGTPVLDTEMPFLELGGAIVLPCLNDVHVHLDKGQIWPRHPNPDGTFAGAIGAVAADRVAHWNMNDVQARMQFGLECAYAHGTSAIRTHLDSIGPQIGISWPVFAALR